MKKREFSAKSCGSLSREQIQKMKIFKYYTEKDKKNIWTKLSSLGQEPTFKYQELIAICTFLLDSQILFLL